MQAYNTLQATFRAGTTRPLSWRKHQLNQLVLMLRENIESIVQAFSVDLRKPPAEVFTGEVGPIVRRAILSVAQLDEWANDESPQMREWQRTWSATILKRPKGVVLVISWVHESFYPTRVSAISPPFPLTRTRLTGPGTTPFF